MPKIIQLAGSTGSNFASEIGKGLLAYQTGLEDFKEREAKETRAKATHEAEMTAMTAAMTAASTAQEASEIELRIKALDEQKLREDLGFRTTDPSAPKPVTPVTSVTGPGGPSATTTPAAPSFASLLTSFGGPSADDLSKKLSGKAFIPNADRHPRYIAAQEAFIKESSAGGGLRNLQEKLTKATRRGKATEVTAIRAKIKEHKDTLVTHVIDELRAAEQDIFEAGRESLMGVMGEYIESAERSGDKEMEGYALEWQRKLGDLDTKHEKPKDRWNEFKELSEDWKSIQGNRHIFARTKEVFEEFLKDGKKLKAVADHKTSGYGRDEAAALAAYHELAQPVADRFNPDAWRERVVNFRSMAYRWDSLANGFGDELDHIMAMENKKASEQSFRRHKASDTLGKALKATGDQGDQARSLAAQTAWAINPANQAIPEVTAEEAAQGLGIDPDTQDARGVGADVLKGQQAMKYMRKQWESKGIYLTEDAWMDLIDQGSDLIGDPNYRIDKKNWRITRDLPPQFGAPVAAPVVPTTTPTTTPTTPTTAPAATPTTTPATAAPGAAPPPPDDTLRPDGTPKGPGYFGTKTMTGGPDKGKDATEMSVSVGASDVGSSGDDVLIPTMVSTLTKKELDWLLAGGDPLLDPIKAVKTGASTPTLKDTSIASSIIKKAIASAKERIATGVSPFKEHDWVESVARPRVDYDPHDRKNTEADVEAIRIEGIEDKLARVKTERKSAVYRQFLTRMSTPSGVKAEGLRQVREKNQLGSEWERSSTQWAKRKASVQNSMNEADKEIRDFWKEQGGSSPHLKIHTKDNEDWILLDNLNHDIRTAYMLRAWMVEEGTSQFDTSASPAPQKESGWDMNTWSGFFTPGEYDRSGWLEKVVPIAAKLYREDSNL